MTRYDDAISRIDANNGEDPTLVPADGAEIPAELAYGRRMSAALASLYPEASEELRIACRAQHIRRWTLPRNAYPMDRAGYHRWRTELKDRHARLTGEIMRECGYGDPQIARVEQLIRKENLKRDGEAQALEDVAVHRLPDPLHRRVRSQARRRQTDGDSAQNVGEDVGSRS